VTLRVIKIQEITQIAVGATASTAILQEDHQDSIITESLSMSVSHGPVRYKCTLGMTGITFVISSTVTFITDQTFFKKESSAEIRLFTQKRKICHTALQRTICSLHLKNTHTHVYI